MLTPKLFLKIKGNRKLALVECGCGHAWFILSYQVGKVRMCVNCSKKLKSNLKHGMESLPEYAVWLTMKQRCNNIKNRAHKWYGARGIKVCPEWNRKDGFKYFFNDMGSRPSNKHTLERINNDGNYEPSNCKWATWSEQQSNRRNSIKNRI